MPQRWLGQDGTITGNEAGELAATTSGLGVSVDLKELLWRAARVAVPLSVLVSGCGAPPRVIATKPVDSVCSCSAYGDAVEVKTDLDAGVPLTKEECENVCGVIACERREPTSCRLETQERVVCFVGCVEGRPPTNGCRPAESEPWARMAWFEAQSAHEFEQLATQLEALGAPAHFVSRARVAANEERGHARIAERRAGHAVNVDSTPVQLKSLRELAFENFLGGCINETASAVVSAYQSDVLGDEDLRQLANEEVGHAEYSWELHAWLVSSLDAQQRRELAIAGEQKIVAMLDFEETVTAEVGRPSNELRRAQLATLEASLWRPALAALLP